jgi:hypothetical protein
MGVEVVKVRHLPCRNRVPAAGIGVSALLRVIKDDARPHVDEMTDRCALIRGRRNFGHVVRHRRVDVEFILVVKDARHQPGNGFGRRHQDVRRRLGVAVGVKFERDVAIPQDDEAIGRRGAQEPLQI